MECYITQTRSGARVHARHVDILQWVRIASTASGMMMVSNRRCHVHHQGVTVLGGLGNREVGHRGHDGRYGGHRRCTVNGAAWIAAIGSATVTIATGGYVAATIADGSVPYQTRHR